MGYDCALDIRAYVSLAHPQASQIEYCNTRLRQQRRMEKLMAGETKGTHGLCPLWLYEVNLECNSCGDANIRTCGVMFIPGRVVGECQRGTPAARKQETIHWHSRVERAYPD